MSNKKEKEVSDDVSKEEPTPEFLKTMKDFLTDLISTFPEYKDAVEGVLIDIMEEKKDSKKIQDLYVYCKGVYPERFFDLLYQNYDIFENEEINTTFLPNIEFKEVWKKDISEKTKTIIWKYLQLICFTIINDVKDAGSFGDTAHLFEAIDEDELKSKLEETMEQMAKVFDMSGNPFENSDTSGVNMDDMPNPEDIHEHISGLIDGKLGRLASEITEETMKDFQDISGATSVGDIFQALFKDPGRLMSMVKKVGGNLDAKIKSGEIKESELMEEASEMMKKLHKMPGMGNMQKMMSEMGLPMGGKNGKVDMGAFQGKMQQNIGKAKTKERMRRKLAERKKTRTAQDSQIKLLQEQLEAAKNANISMNNLLQEEGIKKKKKKKKENVL